jgi:hypothetical protein
MSKLCLITMLGGGEGEGGGLPHPSHPIHIPGPEPGHPIVIPVPPDLPERPVDPGFGVTPPVDPGFGGGRPAGGVPHPSHPIAPGGERPTPPIYLPILPPGEPTHPIVLPPAGPGKPPVVGGGPGKPPDGKPPDVGGGKPPLFELRYSLVYGWVLVPTFGEPDATPKR